MPFFKFLSILLFSAFMLSSCEEDIILDGDFVETAVVYGLLDQADSIHMIKITRAFIGPGSALDIAQIADSNYFDQVDATISEVVNGQVTRTWTLKDSIVQDKDTNGLFYGPEQKVYYFKTLPTGPLEAIQTSPNPLMSSLIPTATYRFKAVINGGEFEVTGQTDLVHGMTSPAASQNFTFKFADDPGEYISSGVSISNTGNSYITSAHLDILFNEHQGTAINLKSFRWKLGEAPVEPYTSRTFSANGRTFYDLIKSNVTANPSIDKRTFKAIRVILTGGAEDLYNYMSVNAPSSSLAQNKPTYTNLSVSNGKRVVGIFSSRQTVTYYKPFYTSPQQAYIRAIDKKSTRELCSGPITGFLLFCSNHPGDNVVGQEESFACN
ncbi:MAG: DUF4249 family protein [Sphingomonadales bacterium]|nr:DUF4249 family protein [Sphingomonadales bacterium]